MESDLQQHHYNIHDHNQKQMNSGLNRYQSAPSSYFSSFLDKDFPVVDKFINRPLSPETERIFEQFLQSTTDSEKHPEIKMEEEEPPPPSRPPQEKQSSYPPVSPHGLYQQQLQNRNPGLDPGSSMGYRPAGTTGTDRLPPPAPVKVGRSSGGGNSNLIRHSSSPAGLFDTISIENAYVVMRGRGDFGGGNNTNRETTFNATSKPPPSPLNPISEMSNQNDHSSSWDDSALTANNVSSSRGLRNDRRTLSAGLNVSEIKNVEGANRPPLLAHHLSLPKSLSEMIEIEKLLQLDSVPCKIRAKRGCATHPRSIAERVRRTKISERMKKLQDLVPNMDKQTNTADMLDLAVEYIKDLQNHVKALSEDRAKCTCSNTDEAIAARN